VAKQQTKPVMKFRLRAGRYTGFVPNTQPDPDTKVRPSTDYRAGDGSIIESEIDLVEKFGAEKFEYVDLPRQGSRSAARDVGDESNNPSALRADNSGSPSPGSPTPQVAAESPSVTPHGQVQTGRQVTTSDLDRDRPPMSRAESAEEAYAHKGEAEEAASQAEGTRTGTERDAVKDEEGEESTATAGQQDLDALTVSELRGIAQDEEIELHGAARKDDIIKAIRKGRRGR
jgi:hypothetical protein